MAEEQRIEHTLPNGSVLVVEADGRHLTWEVWCSEGRCSAGQYVLTIDEAVRMAARKR